MRLGVMILRVYPKQQSDYLVELFYLDYRIIMARTSNKTETR